MWIPGQGFLYALPHFISPEYSGRAGGSNGSEIDLTLCNAFRDPDADICDQDDGDGGSQARFDFPSLTISYGPYHMVKFTIRTLLTHNECYFKYH